MDNLHLQHAGACRTAFDHTPVACGRVLFLGEDNPVSSDPRHALFPHPEGCAGNRLQSRILRVDRAAYLATWRTNLCSPGWSLPRARERALKLLEPGVPWDVIVALGAKVSHVMGELTVESGTSWSPFTVRESWAASDDNFRRCIRIVYLPHPSGRCVVWNNPAAAADARKLLSEVLPEYPWGAP